MVEDLKFKTTSTHIPINSSLITKFYSQESCILQLSTLHMKNKWLKFQNGIALRFSSGPQSTYMEHIRIRHKHMILFLGDPLSYVPSIFPSNFQTHSASSFHSNSSLCFLDLFLQNSLICLSLGDLISNPHKPSVAFFQT